MISLPNNLKLTYVYEDKELDITNWTPLLVDYNDYLTLETKDGKFKFKKVDKLIEFITRYSVCFCYLPPGKADLILSLFDEVELAGINLLGEIEYKEVKIKRIKNNIQFDSTPVINLIPYTNIAVQPTYENIHNLCLDIINSRKETFGLYNLSTPAAEARALFLKSDPAKDEILLARRLGIDKLDLVNAACYGGRMESSGLGTQHQYHYDLSKAHLNFLTNYPGLRDTRWVVNSSKFIQEALPNSIYRIAVKVPRLFKYNPLPIRVENNIKYPEGNIRGQWYSKPYIDLLIKYNIPFKILSSIQFVGNPTYPFREITTVIRGISTLIEDKYPHLETKHLYATLTGSTKSIYRDITDVYSEQQIAGRCFNPLVYSYVMSMQNTKIFEDAIETDAEAIKIDSIATNKLVPRLENEGYKLKDYGISTYLTPSLKSLPQTGKSIYRDAIKQYRDLPYILVQVNCWNSLSGYMGESYDEGSPKLALGEQYVRNIKLKPNYGNRSGRKVKRVGELLDAWLMSSNKAGDQHEEGLESLKLNTYISKYKI